LTEIAGETQRKNGEKSDKDYSIEWFGNICIIRYKGEIYNRASFEKIPFIDYLGWIAVLFAGIIYIVLGICLLIPSMLITIYTMEINFLLMYLVILVFALITGMSFGMGFNSFVDISYIKNTTCKKCHKKYAYNEMEEPDIKEVSTEKSYKVTITRYWKCKHCGFMDTSEGKERMRYYKGRKGREVEIKCGKCRKKGILPECRKPDIKIYDPVATKTCYYRCEYCGHINVSIKKGSVDTEGGITYKNVECGPRL